MWRLSLKQLRLISILLLALAPLAAAAAPKKIVVVDKKRKVPAYQIEKEELARGGTMLVERQREYSLSLQPIGITGFGASWSLSGGYYIGTSLLIEGSYGQTSRINIDLDSKIYGVRLRSSFGGSFYTSVGLARQTFTFATEETYTNILIADEPRLWRYEAEAARTVLDLSVGNRWDYRYFSVGCDWVGVLVPLQKGKIKIQMQGVAENIKDQQDAQSDMQKFIDDTDLQVLHLYVGTTF